MVPQTLKAWTLKSIADLCLAAEPEGDRHDFKLDLQDAKQTTKLCCAFANTYGGFLILGVKDYGKAGCEIQGLEPNAGIAKRLRDRIAAEPQIAIARPEIITVGDTGRVLYIFEIARSPRRPHLPVRAEDRMFYKRVGSSCVPMTLEEIRQQMLNYEEKREKLTLLLLDIKDKIKEIDTQARRNIGEYDGQPFGFEVIDRVVVESFSILKDDIDIIGKLRSIRRLLQGLNFEQQKVLIEIGKSPGAGFNAANAYQAEVDRAYPHITVLCQQVIRSLKENFGIEDPYSD